MKLRPCGLAFWALLLYFLPFGAEYLFAPLAGISVVWRIIVAAVVLAAIALVLFLKGNVRVGWVLLALFLLVWMCFPANMVGICQALKASTWYRVILLSIAFIATGLETFFHVENKNKE
ncbi:MAG: hypothetical protein IKN74_06680 [Clostridia bacterium]|nr:hypothetical protein [Clostridia bacterium]